MRFLPASDRAVLVELDDLPQALAAIEALPADGSWDMIKLYGREPEKIADQGPLVQGSLQLISYQRVPSFAAGYVISRSGARKMLEARVPFDRPVDVDIRFWFENDLRVYGVYPSVISLDDTSEISSIWAQKEAPANRLQKMRKFKMKLALSWGNFRASKPLVTAVLKR